MKTDRLLGILVLLLSREKVTAPCLAERFEVSRRTISRDIDDLCKAGIPIVTTQGRNGGISVMEGYCLDRRLLSGEELEAIMAGLRSLDSVSRTRKYRELMEKISGRGEELPTALEHIRIDLSSWYRETLSRKIELIREAVFRGKRIRFRYCSPKGESERTVEPCQLLFQWSSWYVWGYCVERGAFRMFKLNRMTELLGTEEAFEKREAPKPVPDTRAMFPEPVLVEAVFAPEKRWRLMEEFGEQSFSEREDGKLLFSFRFGDKENVLNWLLSFGDKAELLSPREWREELKTLAGGIWKLYSRRQ